MSKSHPQDDRTDTQWTPERWGFDWGQGTAQSRLERDDGDKTIDDLARNRTDGGPPLDVWSDAYEMRMRFGIPAFDPEAFEYDVYPDVLKHEKPAVETSSAGGTDWLKVGERGCGKTTDNLNWALRLMEVNDEKVIWRGAPTRSGWKPFAPWTTLWLPEHASINARRVYEVDSRPPAPIDDLSGVVRSVRYYGDVLDLIDKLGDHPEGTFNVVYPDPSFSGCEELTRRSSRVSGTLPFKAEWLVGADEDPTPLTHWWFAFMLARVEFARTAGWWSWLFDETADLVPPSVEQDDHRTHSKLMLYRSLMQDSRREKFSVYNTIHRESQINWRVREEHMWRVDMPDETPNPRRRSKRSIPQGFSTVPMIGDIMSDRGVGQALMFNERHFSLYQWTDIKRQDERAGKLKIALEPPEGRSKQPSADSDSSEVSD